MKHDEFYELLPDYAKGGLEEAEIRTVDAHLADCSDCANELSDLRKLQERFEILKAERKRELPALAPDFVDRLMQRAESYQRRRRLSLVAAVLALLALLLFYFRKVLLKVLL